jgi:hypothetical protein
MVVLLTTDATRGTTMRLSREGSLVESLTAAIFAVGGGLGLWLAVRLHRRSLGRWPILFLLLFGLGLWFLAMEEIAWGQKVFGFETPDLLAGVNKQGDFTLHNLPGVHGHSDIMWTTFAVGGMIGVWLGSFERFRLVGAAPALLPWFLIIAGIALPLIIKDFTGAQNRFITLFGRMDEFNEVLISLACCVYLVLCARRVIRETSQTPAATDS